jgi:hypothetical protein
VLCPKYTLDQDLRLRWRYGGNWREARGVQRDSGGFFIVAAVVGREKEGVKRGEASKEIGSGN